MPKPTANLPKPLKACDSSASQLTSTTVDTLVLLTKQLRYHGVEAFTLGEFSVSFAKQAASETPKLWEPEPEPNPAPRTGPMTYAEIEQEFKTVRAH